MNKIFASCKGSKIEIIFDEQDYDKLKEVSWNYGSGSIRGHINGRSRDARKQIIIGRLITNCEKDDIVTYKDGNRLNNSRSNLKVIRDNSYTIIGEKVEIKVDSNKHGIHLGFFDLDKLDLLRTFKWGITGSRKTKYFVTYENDKMIYMHHLVYGKNVMIDHKDQNGLNNSFENLRETTNSLNCLNKDISSSNTSGYKGVFVIKNRQKKKFWAYISVNNKRIGGGLFETALDAAKKYNEMALKYHREYAKLNII